MAFPKLDLPPFRVTASGLLIPGNPVGGNMASEQDHFTRTLGRWGDEVERWAETSVNYVSVANGNLELDPYGNQPLMERKVSTVTGNNINQTLTSSDVQIGNLTTSISCPTGVTTAKVRVNWKLQVTANLAGGPNGNYAKITLYVDGVPLTGYEAAAYYQVEGGGVQVFIWNLDKTSEVSITAGQTRTFAVRGGVNTSVTPTFTYTGNTGSDRAGMRATLLY